MASTSAHFNLTKPATTDYYNIGVFNDNTDIIDTQMYNNQVSAAKIMIGATANDDGESGRVPVPHAGDQNKYLCADGTWKTVSGGGGGSTVTITPTLSSGTKIADYSINGASGSLYAPSGGGGGGSHAYSTTEQIVGTWIDGSDTYERTIHVNTSIPTQQYIPILSGESIDLIGVNSDGTYFTTSSGQRWSAFAAYTNGGMLIYQEPNRDVTIYNNSGQIFTDGYVTIRYIKVLTGGNS